jgi:outer membrane protein, heavy metal efflux system
MRRLAIPLVAACFWALPAPGAMPPAATAPAGAPVRKVALRPYLEEVLRTNLDLQAARFGVSVADAQVTLAKLLPDPQVSGGIDTMDLTDQKLPTTVVYGLSQTVELGGKRRARVAEAAAGRSLAEAQLEDTLQSVRANAAKAFVDALSARQLLALRRRTLESVERLVSATEHRLRVGDVSATALAQVKVEAERFRGEVTAAEGEVAASDLALELFLGPAMPGIPPIEPVGDLGKAARELEEGPLVAKALETRSDLLVALRSLDVAKAHVGTVQAGRWIDPTVAAEMKQAPSDPANGLPFSRTLGLTLSMPLPFSRLTKADLEGARAAAGQAGAQGQAARKRVEVEVRQALARYDAARRTVAIYAGGILANADGALEATRYSYERGAARLIEVLDAQRTVDDVTLGYAGALADRARALVTLERAAAIWDVDF